MQRWWDKSISKNLSVHNGYKQTFVLFIKWEDKIDQLKVGKEVRHIGYKSAVTQHILTIAQGFGASRYF